MTQSGSLINAAMAGTEEAIQITENKNITNQNLSKKVFSATPTQATDGIFGLTGVVQGTLFSENENASDYLADETFSLASRPEADITFYLDFDGAIISNTYWNNEAKNSEEAADLLFAPFSIDDRSDFSQTELYIINETWETVSQNFIQFGVNVTTTLPEAGDIIRESEDDTRYGVHVIFTEHVLPGFEDCECSGVATLATFGEINHKDAPAPVFVNPDFSENGYNLRSASKIAWVLAHIATHEIAHALGLSHDGSGDHTEYAPPLAGVSFFMGSTPGSIMFARWSDGSIFENIEERVGKMINREDDLDFLADKLGLISDDFPDSPGSPDAPLIPLESGTAHVNGILTDHQDKDVFRVYIPERSLIRVHAAPSRLNYQLSAEVELFDSRGNSILSAEKASRFKNREDALQDERVKLIKLGPGRVYDPRTETIYAVVEAGVYSVRVSAQSGMINGNPNSDNNYGSLGSWVSTVHSFALEDEYDESKSPRNLYDTVLRDQLGISTAAKKK